MRILIATMLIVCLGSALGCGPKRSKEEIERGRQALNTALTAWKAGDSPERLKATADPMEFSDDLRRQFELVDYSIGAIDAKEPPYLRYSVKMTFRDKRGQTSEREVVYSVELTKPIRIVRDPYF
jgi:hypothetical protein